MKYHFTDLVNLVSKILLLPPQNPPGCAVVPLKYTRDKAHTQANKSRL